MEDKIPKLALAGAERERGGFDRDEFPWSGLRGAGGRHRELQQLEGRFCYMSRQAALREMAGSPAKHQRRPRVRHEACCPAAHLRILSS